MLAVGRTTLGERQNYGVYLFDLVPHYAFDPLSETQRDEQPLLLALARLAGLGDARVYRQWERLFVTPVDRLGWDGLYRHDQMIVPLVPEQFAALREVLERVTEACRVAYRHGKEAGSDLLSKLADGMHPNEFSELRPKVPRGGLRIATAPRVVSEEETESSDDSL